MINRCSPPIYFFLSLILSHISKLHGDANDGSSPSSRWGLGRHEASFSRPWGCRLVPASALGTGSFPFWKGVGSLQGGKDTGSLSSLSVLPITESEMLRPSVCLSTCNCSRGSLPTLRTGCYVSPARHFWGGPEAFPKGPRQEPSAGAATVRTAPGSPRGPCPGSGFLPDLSADNQAQPQFEIRFVWFD